VRATLASAAQLSQQERDNEMKVYVIFGQRKCRYQGEYDVEALAVASEADFDENPDYLRGELKKYQDCQEFEGLAMVALEVPRASILQALFPASKPIEAKVVS